MKENNKYLGYLRLDNGAIGEAKTKAFLIDRFWILERTIDKDGADFIIQRKINSQNILDEISPRFGIIQSKFSKDEKTTHLIDKQYVVDKKGNPYKEFFLILNIGKESNQKMCLLSANDIFKNFTTNKDNKFKLSTKKILEKFEIKNTGFALDIIENSIQEVEFLRNRIYLFTNLKEIKPDFESINPEFKYDINFSDGNIIDIFKEYKMNAYNFIKKIEDIHFLLTEFIKETNPLESCLLAEDFNRWHSGSLDIPQIFDNDFFDKINNYIEQINKLKNDEILDNYLNLSKEIKFKTKEFIKANNTKLENKPELIICIEYNKTNFKDFKISFKINSINKYNEYCDFTKLEEGEIIFFMKCGLDIDISKKIKNGLNEVCFIKIVQKIYELKYFESNKA